MHNVMFVIITSDTMLIYCSLQLTQVGPITINIVLKVKQSQIAFPNCIGFYFLGWLAFFQILSIFMATRPVRIYLQDTN